MIGRPPGSRRTGTPFPYPALFRSNESWNGGNGRDILNGGPGGDVINGGDGSDILVSGVGDTLDGGDDNGDDLVRIDAIGASITTTNVGGDTFLNLSTVLTDFDYD